MHREEKWRHPVVEAYISDRIGEKSFSEMTAEEEGKLAAFCACLTRQVFTLASGSKVLMD